MFFSRIVEDAWLPNECRYDDEDGDWKAEQVTQWHLRESMTIPLRRNEKITTRQSPIYLSQAFEGDWMRSLRAMLEVQSVCVRQVTRGRNRTSDPNKVVNRKCKWTRKLWVRPPAGAGGLNKSMSYYKWSIRTQKKTSVIVVTMRRCDSGIGHGIHNMKEFTKTFENA